MKPIFWAVYVCVHLRVQGWGWAVFGSDDFALIHSICHPHPEFSELLSCWLMPPRHLPTLWSEGEWDRASCCPEQLPAAGWEVMGRAGKGHKGLNSSENLYLEMSWYIQMLAGWRAARNILQSYSCCFQQDNCVATLWIIQRGFPVIAAQWCLSTSSRQRTKKMGQDLIFNVSVALGLCTRPAKPGVLREY